MAGQGAGDERIEKSVNSAQIPSTSESLNLWETEQIDHSILSYYFESKGPNSPVSVNPQSKIFTVNLKPSKHFTSCRASYISFEVRLIKLPSHDKLPPIHPAPTSDSPQTAGVMSQGTRGDNNLSANDNESSVRIDQSEARPQTQHECIGNKFVLEQDSDELERNRKYEEKKERYEMEKKKKQERMQRWLEEQEEYRRRWRSEYPESSEAKNHKMQCKRRREGLTTEAADHDLDSKRRKMMDQREFHDGKRKRQTDCPTDRDMAFKMIV